MLSLALVAVAAAVVAAAALVAVVSALAAVAATPVTLWEKLCPARPLSHTRQLLPGSTLVRRRALALSLRSLPSRAATYLSPLALRGSA